MLRTFITAASFEKSLFTTHKQSSLKSINTDKANYAIDCMLQDASEALKW